MNMQRVQLNISSDIFDKVIFFLENLPKNKIELNFDTVFNNANSSNKNLTLEKKSIFGDFLNHTQQVHTITKFNRDELNER